MIMFRLVTTGFLGEVYVDGKIIAVDLLNNSTLKRSMAGNLLINYILLTTEQSFRDQNIMFPTTSQSQKVLQLFIYSAWFT